MIKISQPFVSIQYPVNISIDGTENNIFTWKFSDSIKTHYQSSYNIQYKETVIGSPLIDLGWINSSNSEHTFNANTFTNGKTYAWRIKVKDSTTPVAEIASLTITSGCTVDGNVTITLNGNSITVALLATDNTASLVATKIRNTSFTGWTTGGTGNTITFTANTVGSKIDAIYSAGSTGVTGNITTTTQGANYIESLFSDWVIFKTSTRPLCQITYPQNDNDVIPTDIPTIQHEFIESSGQDQKSYQYKLYNDNDNLLWTSNLATDDNNLVVIPKGLIVENNYYKVDVTITDIDGMCATSAKRRFLANFLTALSNANFSAIPDSENSKMNLRWAVSKSIMGNYVGSGERYLPSVIGNGIEIGEYGEKVYWNINITEIFTIATKFKLSNITTNGTILYLHNDSENYIRLKYEASSQRFIIEKTVSGIVRTIGSTTIVINNNDNVAIALKQTIEGIELHVKINTGSIVILKDWTEDSPPVTQLKVENMGLYYGYPSSVNGSGGDVTTATNHFSQFDIVILGDGIEHSAHGDHIKTQQIIQNLNALNKKVFGYISIGMNDPLESYAIEVLRTNIDEWYAMGAYGIFVDEYGFDYDVTRARQNDVLDYIHSKGMFAIMNAWNVDDACGDLDEIGVNNPAHIVTGDYYLLENWIASADIIRDMGVWKPKVEQCMTYKQSKGVGILALNTVADPFTLGINDPRFKLISAASMMYGIDGVQFRQTQLSAQQLGFFSIQTNYGTIYTDNITPSWDNTQLYRHTDTGTIVLTQNGTTYDGYYTTANEQPPTPPAQIVTDGLVGYWNAEQGISGTTINNLATATNGSYNGTMANVTVQSDGLLFNGTSSKITIPYAYALTDMTFECWVTPDTPTTEETLFSIDSNNKFAIQTNNTLKLKEYIGGVATYSYGNSATAIIPTQLNHIVLRITGTTIEFIVNGVKYTANTSAGALQTTGTQIALGVTGSSYWFKGLYHIARLYNRPLTDDEILINRAVGI